MIDAVKNVQNLHPVQLKASLKNTNKLTFHRPKYIHPQSRKVALALGSWQPLVKNSQALPGIFFYQTAGNGFLASFKGGIKNSATYFKHRPKHGTASGANRTSHQTLNKESRNIESKCASIKNMIIVSKRIGFPSSAILGTCRELDENSSRIARLDPALSKKRLRSPCQRVIQIDHNAGRLQIYE
ncbi:MAG: hypothetical protein P4L53_12660 [Candidatus Obscuribacterales bacterium]|nr:hypothetical protein [Candidatus Obscuribacterales bacterium]